MNKRKGFSLHEVLVVLATVGILGVVAVPKYQEAQIKQKIAQVRSDFQEMATAIEAYYVDWEYYPMNPLPTGSMFLGPGITTPVAYIDRLKSDPFNEEQSESINGYRYSGIVTYEALSMRLPYYFSIRYGDWRLSSDAPDQVMGPMNDKNLGWNLLWIYDPTNGLISTGDIIRCQRFEEMKTNLVE